MIGAKVDMDKARKEKLCFNCGKAGHQAKYCRSKRPGKKEAPTKIGMISYGLVDPGQRNYNMNQSRKTATYSTLKVTLKRSTIRLCRKNWLATIITHISKASGTR
jgi:Zinc knuckle